MTSQDGRFLRGAFTLTLAGFLVKLIGALYRIPLYSILGSEGMGLFGMAYPIYAIMLTVSSAGFNVAISKAVAERWALGRTGDARRVFRVSLFLMTAIGFAGTLVLYYLRGFIAVNLAKDPRAELCIAAIAPALLAAGVLSALRGWFQGVEEMTVPAVSQVLEQLGRLAAMILLARALLPKGLEYASAGATFGAVVGATVGIIYVAGAYRSQKRRRVRLTEHVTESWREAVGAILAVALPISLASAIFGLTELVDLGIVPGRLQSVGVPRAEATMLYGQLTQAALPLVNIATVFTGALQMAIVPSITGATALGDSAGVRRRVARALTITLGLALPASVGLYVLAGPIPWLLYNEQTVGAILKPLAPAVLFLAFQQVTAGVLQGIGRVTVPLVNLGIAIIVKGILTYFLVTMPGVGIVGAAIATTAYFAVAALLNSLAVKKHVGSLLILTLSAKIALASLGMAAATVLCYKASASVLGERLAAVPAIGVGVLTYGILLIVLGAIRGKDLEGIPYLGRFVKRFFR